MANALELLSDLEFLIKEAKDKRWNFESIVKEIYRIINYY
jgi:hypothetical protein